jgi:hypothetical protein
MDSAPRQMPRMSSGDAASLASVGEDKTHVRRDRRVAAATDYCAEIPSLCA